MLQLTQKKMIAKKLANLQRSSAILYRIYSSIAYYNFFLSWRLSLKLTQILNPASNICSVVWIMNFTSQRERQIKKG